MNEHEWPDQHAAINPTTESSPRSATRLWASVFGFLSDAAAQKRGNLRVILPAMPDRIVAGRLITQMSVVRDLWDRRLPDLRACMADLVCLIIRRTHSLLSTLGPLFVYSDMKPKVQMADRIADIISWWVRLTGMNAERRPELNDLA